MLIDSFTFRYPNRWQATSEEDERFVGLCEIMLSICDAFDATDQRVSMEEFLGGGLVDRDCYPTPLSLAAAMEEAAARIRRLTD
jgi:hypothetical protein